MTTIAAIGTATQICEWMGVPDPSIRPVMARLREAGLTTVIDGRKESSSPQYNTAEALELYLKIFRAPIPPAASRALEAARLEQARRKAQEQIAAQRAAEVQAEAEKARRAQQAEEADRRLKERTEELAAARKRAQEEADAQALERGLATYHMIGRRYDELNSTGKINNAFQTLLRRNGLEEADSENSIKLFDQEAADEAVQASRLPSKKKRPKRDWTGVEIEYEEELPDDPPANQAPRAKRQRRSTPAPKKSSTQLAHEAGRVVRADIGQRFGVTGSHAQLEKLMYKLRIWGLTTVEGEGYTYDPKMVDQIAQDHEVEPSGDWPSGMGETSTPDSNASKLWSAEAFLKDKKLDGENVDPDDYYTIERELNTSYALNPISDIGVCKLYRLADWNRAWKQYLRDTE
jgi:hypothetical protein